MRSSKLMVRFVFFSFVIIVSIGIFTGRVLIEKSKEHIFDSYANSAVAIHKSITHNFLKESDFTPGNSRLSGSKFDELVKGNAINNEIVFVKIWKNDGTVLYSNNKKIIGQKFAPDKRYKEALAGKVTYEESSLESEENLFERPKYSRLFEVYSPIVFNGKVLGVFESYFSLDSVIETVNKISISVVLLLSAGLGILLLTLSGMVKGAESTINNQNGQINEFAEQQVQSIKQLKENYIGTMQSLASAVEARDSYTSGHSSRTRHLSILIGRQLNLTSDQILNLYRASVVHDIGKIGTPDSVLTKPGALNAKEWLIMKEHPCVGAKIIESIPFLKDLALIVKHHHERYDGNGYPDGLKDGEIPVESQILAVADAFDAMTSDRPYRTALSTEEATKRIKIGSGTQFAPEVVDAFLFVYNNKKTNIKKYTGGITNESQDDYISAGIGLTS